MSRHNYGAVAQTEVSFVGQQYSPEFNGLCDNVVTNIYTINSSLKTLNSALKNIGTPRDNQGLRNNIHVTQLSTNQIAAVTTKNLQRLKLLLKKNDKQQQLQVEKLEENFKEAVNRYHMLQKEVASQQKMHLLVSVNVENEEAQEDQDSNQAQMQAQVARELEFEQDMLLEREARIRQIEADVLDVNQIMRELGSMVNEQTEVIDSIENQIDHTAGNVEEATEQLQQASRYQNKYRKRLLIIGVIGLIIAAILIGVLVAEFKK